MSIQKSYDFIGSSALTLNNGATITNLGSNTTFGGPMLILGGTSGSATISGAGTSTLISGGSISGAQLNVQGGQTFVLGANTAAKLVAGNTGTVTLKAIAGDVQVLSGGTLNAGTGAMYDKTVENLTLAGTVVNRIDTLSSYDAYTGDGTNAVFGGTLQLNFGASAPAFAKGDVFNLFPAFTNYSGNFTGVNSTGGAGGIFALSWGKDANNQWSSTAFSGNNYFVFNETTGNLVVVPEPSTVVFAGVGVAVAGWTAWRKRRLAKAVA